MARSLILLFVSLNLLHRSNCLRRSEWTYDPDADAATFTTNGTTYTCSVWDIVGPVLLGEFNSINDPCLHGSVKSALDPWCIQKLEYVRSVNASRAKSCNVPLPTAEETLVRVEKVYRSSSLLDNPATQEWYDRVLQNLTETENVCEFLQAGKVKSILKTAPTAFNISHVDWPRQRDNVSDAQIAFQKALRREYEAQVRNLTATYDNERYDRERMFAMEILALRGYYENELAFWYRLQQLRTNFIQNMSRSVKMEHLEAGAREAVKIRMDMLYKMSAANEMLARIEFIVRDVACDMELVCPPRSYYDKMID